MILRRPESARLTLLYRFVTSTPFFFCCLCCFVSLATVACVWNYAGRCVCVALTAARASHIDIVRAKAFEGAQQWRNMLDQATSGRDGSSRSDSHGSRTLTIERHATPEADSFADTHVGTLYLQGTQPDNQDVPSRRRSRQRVVWTEDTVDNEGCGKKKSKSTCIATHISVCCIYHKKRAFDESSSESSASSDGDDSEPDISSSDDGEPTSARSLPSSHTHGAGCSHSSKPPPRNAYERSSHIDVK